MTYREKFEELEKAYADKTALHFKANQKLSKANGFFDKADMDNFIKTKAEAEEAGAEFYKFVAHLKQIKVKPEDIIG